MWTSTFTFITFLDSSHALNVQLRSPLAGGSWGVVPTWRTCSLPVSPPPFGRAGPLVSVFTLHPGMAVTWPHRRGLSYVCVPCPKGAPHMLLFSAYSAWALTLEAILLLFFYPPPNP